MKKLMSITLTILISLLFVSCSNGSFICDINPDLGICQKSYDPITDDTDGLIKNKSMLLVNDVADDFDFNVSFLTTFSHEENEDIDYVDVEEFLYVMSGGLVNYKISTGSTLVVSYNQRYGNSLLSSYEFRFELDPEENTIYYNDFNFIDSFNGNSSLEYNSLLYVSDFDYTEGDTLERTIDLDDYDIITAYEDGVYFIPLYLANLLFTGSYINVYASNDVLYIVDDFSLIADVMEDTYLEAGVNEENITWNTVNYTALFFDNFYGLKDYKGVDSYLTDFDTYGLFDVTTLRAFDELFDQYVLDLDDLHTGIYSYGWNGANLEYAYPAEDSKLMKFLEVYQNDICYLREEEYRFIEYEDYYVMELNEFTLETVDYLNQSLKNIDPDKPIFIDLACNSGGSAIAVIEVLTYLTDNPIPMSYIVPATGEKFVESYSLEVSNKLDNDFYIFTSNMTYSAANLMTSMAKDAGIATIIGTETTGGACAVLFTVLPNNMVLTYSSQMALTNARGELIEDGILPDFYINQSYSIIDTLDYIQNYYDLFALRTINADRHLNDELTIYFTTDALPEGVEVDKYIVELYNSDDQLIDSEEIETLSFTYNYEGDYSYFKITVGYVFKGVYVEDTIY